MQKRHSSFQNRNYKRQFINGQIRFSPVRVVDEQGQQLGTFPIEEALRISQEQGLDLVLITDKTTPPICKIIDYGKYRYQLEKKSRGQHKQKGGETKGIRFGFNTAKHDLELRAKQAAGFLNENNKVKIEVVLRGRERMRQDLAKEKIKEFIAMIPLETVVEQEARQMRGLTAIIKKA